MSLCRELPTIKGLMLLPGCKLINPRTRKHSRTVSIKPQTAVVQDADLSENPDRKNDRDARRRGRNGGQLEEEDRTTGGCPAESAADNFLR